MATYSFGTLQSHIANQSLNGSLTHRFLSLPG